MAQLRLLLVEDNPGDIHLVKQMVERCQAGVTVEVVTTGVEAEHFLARKGKYENASRPDLIFLDLNLPQKSGMEVLKGIKSNPEISYIPVIIFTSSEAQNDILDSYKFQANAYLAKPMRIEEFNRIGDAIDRFWFNAAKLPELIDG